MSPEKARGPCFQAVVASLTAINPAPAEPQHKFVIYTLPLRFANRTPGRGNQPEAKRLAELWEQFDKAGRPDMGADKDVTWPQ